jgi:hypothetical protein
MREPTWKRGTVHSTQPEAGLPPDEGNEATGTPEGGAPEGGGGGGAQGEPGDLPPGKTNPAKDTD